MNLRNDSDKSFDKGSPQVHIRAIAPSEESKKMDG
jgi:hypothetical protein